MDDQERDDGLPPSSDDPFTALADEAAPGRSDRLEPLVILGAVVIAVLIPLVAFLVVHGPGDGRVKTASDTTLTLRPQLTLPPSTNPSAAPTPATSPPPPSETTPTSRGRGSVAGLPPRGTSPCLVFAFALSVPVQIPPTIPTTIPPPPPTTIPPPPPTKPPPPPTTRPPPPITAPPPPSQGHPASPFACFP